MQQRDNQQNHIDQIGKTLVHVSAFFQGMKNRGSLEEAVAQTNIQLHRKLGFNVTQFVSFSQEETLDYAMDTFKSVTHLEFIAGYLFELGDWKRKENKSEALRYYQQSRTLYQLISSQKMSFDFHRSKKEYALTLQIEKLESENR